MTFFISNAWANEATTYTLYQSNAMATFLIQYISHAKTVEYSIYRGTGSGCVTTEGGTGFLIQSELHGARLFHIYKWRQLRFGLETRRACTSFSRRKL